VNIGKYIFFILVITYLFYYEVFAYKLFCYFIKEVFILFICKELIIECFEFFFFDTVISVFYGIFIFLIDLFLNAFIDYFDEDITIFIDDDSV